MSKRIKVLIIDDSAIVRQTLTEILSSDPEIEVIGSASDPYIAANKMREEAPDVITLDVEMPRMDGLTFLQKIMSQHPIPVVICSSLAVNRSETTMKLLEYGAVEIIQKPTLGTREYLRESKIKICDCVKAASIARIKRISGRKEIQPKLTADAILAKASSKAMVKTTEKVIAVGASTGGTEALRILFESLPMDCPGVVVVQHMPENFTKAFAKRLDSICLPSIKEASNNDSVLRGQVLIAPGNRHMLLKRSGARYYVEVREGPLVSRHRPSVDVLFRSAARYAGKNAIGVIMTGMGDDGAKGLLEMKETGAFTIAQDEATSVVFGMPQEAIKLNAVDKILPLDKIGSTIIKEAEN
ncbi:MAG: chemotaxis response regulator protein-glutamate methylesterase [Deltaproteobacteria bacterium]|nr:chemotaxis response regulator protein-glutamate methylesterase [Deltaproteobacteria bacterium]